MPAKAVKPENPPSDLTDRVEGWGSFGRVDGYPDFRDDGEWPFVVVRRSEFEDYPTETNDDRGIGWSHAIE